MVGVGDEKAMNHGLELKLISTGGLDLSLVGSTSFNWIFKMWVIEKVGTVNSKISHPANQVMFVLNDSVILSNFYSIVNMDTNLFTT